MTPLRFCMYESRVVAYFSYKIMETTAKNIIWNNLTLKPKGFLSSLIPERLNIKKTWVHHDAIKLLWLNRS